MARSNVGGTAEVSNLRGRGLRAAAVIVLASAVLAVGGVTATATPAAEARARVVHPTGRFPTDVENVQAAVDGGGLVVLKATTPAGVPLAFNFGPTLDRSGFVDIVGDVELVGEQVPAGVTTIRGGQYPIGSFSDGRVSVRDITFDAPIGGALLLIGPSEVEVIGNTVSGAVGEPRGSALFAEGFVIAGGSARVESNVLEDFDTPRAIGISQFDGTGPVDIVHNRVSGTHTVAIESTRNSGPVRIEHNTVMPGPEREPAGSFGAGIEINGTGEYRVAENDIVIENPNGVGVFAFGA